VPQTNQAGVDYAETTLKSLIETPAVVPSLWALEVSNVIAKVESKSIVTEANSQRFITLLAKLNIVTDQATALHALGDTLHLARRYKISSYDASYLELALRLGLPLSTLDAGLAKAATTAGVPLFGRH
jgi:predicted nucleic acid-binding protein